MQPKYAHGRPAAVPDPRRERKHAQSSHQGTLSWYAKSLRTLSEHNLALSEALDDIEDEQSEQDLPWLCYSALDKPYDPFLVGGETITQRQLALIHSYMHDLVPITFGIPRGAAYSAANYMTHLCLQYSDAGALWTAIFAEDMIHKMNGQPATREMALQKAAGRRALVLSLKNYRENFEAAYIALVKSAQASLWFGNGARQSVYGAAADMLIHSVGGLHRALVLTPNIKTSYFTAVFMFGRALFHTRYALRQGAARFLESLQRILRQDKPGHQRTFRGCIEDPSIQESVSVEYLNKEAETIKRLGPFTDPTDGDSTASRKFCLNLLIQLCEIFIHFSSRLDIIMEAFRNIEHLYGNSFPTAKSKNQLLMQTAPLSGMVGHVRADLLATRMPESRLSSELRVTETTIDGMKIFHYLCPRSQTQILAKLHAWFKHLPRESEPFTVEEFDALTSQALRNWRVQHRESM